MVRDAPLHPGAGRCGSAGKETHRHPCGSTPTYGCAEGLASFLNPQAIDALAAVILAHDAAGRPFRVYGTQVLDIRSQDRINICLHKSSTQDADAIRKYVLFDRMLVARYDELQSDVFQALSAERKIAALTDCMVTARELKDIADTLQAVIETWPELEGRAGPRTGSPAT